MARKYNNFRVGGSPQKVTDDYAVWTNDLLGKVIARLHVKGKPLFLENGTAGGFEASIGVESGHVAPPGDIGQLQGVAFGDRADGGITNGSPEVLTLGMKFLRRTCEPGESQQAMKNGFQ